MLGLFRVALLSFCLVSAAQAWCSGTGFPLRSSTVAKTMQPLAISRRSESARWAMSGDQQKYSREKFLAVLSGFVVLAPSLVVADSTGKFSSKRTAKNRYVPRIQKGVDALNSLEKGEITVEAFLPIADDMVSAMKLYGQAQKRGEYPDKISERCVKDAEAFGKAVSALTSSGSVADAKAKYEAYFGHLPRDGKEPFGTGMAPKADE